jgi:hypothetical protein
VGGGCDELTHPLAQRTPGEQATYKKERLERAKAREADLEHERAHAAHSTATPRVARVRGRASAVNNRILHDKHGTPFFPRAS